MSTSMGYYWWMDQCINSLFIKHPLHTEGFWGPKAVEQLNEYGPFCGQALRSTNAVVPSFGVRQTWANY